MYTWSEYDKFYQLCHFVFLKQLYWLIPTKQCAVLYNIISVCGSRSVGAGSGRAVCGDGSELCLSLTSSHSGEHSQLHRLQCLLWCAVQWEIVRGKASLFDNYVHTYLQKMPVIFMARTSRQAIRSPTWMLQNQKNVSLPLFCHGLHFMCIRGFILKAALYYSGSVGGGVENTIQRFTTFLCGPGGSKTTPTVSGVPRSYPTLQSCEITPKSHSALQ